MLTVLKKLTGKNRVLRRNLLTETKFFPVAPLRYATPQNSVSFRRFWEKLGFKELVFELFFYSVSSYINI